MRIPIRNKLAQNIGIYSIVNVINAGIPFFLLPVLTFHLSPTDFAIISIFQVATNFAMPFAGLNFTSAITVNYFHREKIELPVYIFNGILLLIVSGFTLLLFSLLFQNPIGEVLSFPPAWILWIIVYVVLFKITELTLVLWRVQSKPVPYGILKITMTVIEFSLSLLLIIAYNYSWDGRIISMVGTVLATSLISSFFLTQKKWIKMKFNKSYLIDLLKFGAPLIPHTLGGIIIAFSDRLFIVNMEGEHALGLYTVGYQIGMIISLIQNSFNQAWSPWFYEQLKKATYGIKKKIVKITYFYFLFLLLIVLLLLLFSPIIFKYLIDQSYSNSIDFVIWVGLGFGFNGMYKMMVNYLIFDKKTRLIAILTLSTAAVNIVLNYFMIKEFGTIGAAQSTTLSFLLQFIICFAIVNRKYSIPWLLK